MKQILIEKYIEPSETITIGDGRIIERWLDKYGDRHSFMGHPATLWSCNGEIDSQYWNKNGVRHRDGNLPAEIWYFKGQISYQEYWKNGKFIKREEF
jgi:hypothetical protein